MIRGRDPGRPTGWATAGAVGLGWSVGALQGLVLLIGVANIGTALDRSVALGAGIAVALLGGAGGALVAVVARRRHEDRDREVPPRLGPDHDDAAGRAARARESWLSAALVIGLFLPLVLLLVLPGDGSRRHPDLGRTPSGQVDGRLVLAAVLVAAAVAVVLVGLRAAAGAEARLLAALTELTDPRDTSPDVVRVALALRPVALVRAGAGGSAACQVVVAAAALGPVTGVAGAAAAVVVQGVALRGSRRDLTALATVRRRLPAPD